MKAVSVSAPVLARFAQAATRGVGLGNNYVGFDDYVLALTAPGRPRMPNGIETTARLGRGAEAWLGGGVLEIGGAVVEPGPSWNPVPSVVRRPPGGVPLRPDLDLLVGRGPGLTPAGDDVLAGYVAGLVLFWGLEDQAAAIARGTAGRTTLLSVTLIAHASRGELPEPAHA